jgi:hypothetical protein
MLRSHHNRRSPDSSVGIVMGYGLGGRVPLDRRIVRNTKLFHSNFNIRCYFLHLAPVILTMDTTRISTCVTFCLKLRLSLLDRLENDNHLSSQQIYFGFIVLLLVIFKDSTL